MDNSSKDYTHVVQTLHQLLADLHGDPDSWENPTLDRYLEAMAAWLEASGHKYGPEMSWELVIDMLEAGRIYE